MEPESVTAAVDEAAASAMASLLPLPSSSYVSKLLSFTLDRLHKEQELLRVDAERIQKQMQEVAVGNYCAFIAAADALVSIKDEGSFIDKHLESLVFSLEIQALVAMPPDTSKGWPPPAGPIPSQPTPQPSSTINTTIQPSSFKTPFSYVSAVQKQTNALGPQLLKTPTLGGFSLPPRPAMTVDSAPAILFSARETKVAEKQLEFTIVLKFSTTRPHLNLIQDHISKQWRLKGKFIISLMDPRHVMVYLTSGEDLNQTLSKESHMINHCMYRSFRWSPEISFKVDSPLVAVWVRLHKLPLHYFAPAMLERIGNGLGHFLWIDDRTLAFTHPSFARFCVEVDVSKPLPSKIWIGATKEIGFFQAVEFEGVSDSLLRYNTTMMLRDNESVLFLSLC